MTSCNDCMIWIGAAYPTVRAFVDEAKVRGCSRQVPFWPAWAKTGVTRVFLAHRGSSDRADGGVVFGYFVLQGVDVIVSQPQYDDYKELPGEKPEPRMRFWEDCLPRQLPVKRAPGGGVTNEIGDFIDDLILACEEPVPPGGGCGYVIPTGQTALEARRLCGMRLGPECEQTKDRPSLYFVDAVERRIAEEFCEFLKELIQEMGGRRKTGTTRRSVLLELREKKSSESGGTASKFSAIVDRVSREHEAGIDPIVQSCAKSEGALVVFEKPYPFRRSPAASFRGLLRVDGEELLRKVARHAAGTQPVRERFAVPYCAGVSAVPGGSVTASQLATRMAGELRMNVALAHRVFEWLARTVREELGEHGMIRVPGLGTLRAEEKEGRKVVMLMPRPGLLRQLGCAAVRAQGRTAGRAITVAQLAKRMADDPTTKGANPRRVFAWLAATIHAELSGRGVIRIADVGTLRVREKRSGKLMTFDPSNRLSQ